MKKIRQKLHIKKGDNIKIISGAHKGKIGTITKVIYKKQQVIIKNINMQTKHMQAKQKGDTGQIVQFEAPIHSSNVMLYSAKHKIASRYKHSKTINNLKTRILIKTNEII
uniref:50S ribosomal protein L24, chloroplastic n=1 Tax=Eucheuma denticulatum TaxID=305493 RepID=A0A8E7UER6_9FLOR|nr:50S ribosomal protein L24 [Eucheuma denticulatum]